MGAQLCTHLYSVLFLTFFEHHYIYFFMDTQNSQTTLNCNNLQYLLYIDIHLVSNGNHNLDYHHHYYHIYQQNIH